MKPLLRIRPGDERLGLRREVYVEKMLPLTGCDSVSPEAVELGWKTDCRLGGKGLVVMVVYLFV